MQVFASLRRALPYLGRSLSAVSFAAALPASYSVLASQPEEGNSNIVDAILASWERIPNDFEGAYGQKFQCFGCSPLNAHGLQMQFYKKDGEDSVLGCTTLASNVHSGYPGMVHGGVIATVIDDTAFWTMYTLKEKIGVTREMHNQYLKPLQIGDTAIAKGVIISQTEKECTVQVDVSNQKGVVCASGVVTYRFVKIPLPKDVIASRMETASSKL
jgi:uncharacterized protein (TIGR00369 family)